MSDFHQSKFIGVLEQEPDSSVLSERQEMRRATGDYSFQKSDFKRKERE